GLETCETATACSLAANRDRSLRSPLVKLNPFEVRPTRITTLKKFFMACFSPQRPRLSLRRAGATSRFSRRVASSLGHRLRYIVGPRLAPDTVGRLALNA